MNEPLKICSRCNEAKVEKKDFYCCRGFYRSECKKCTIKKNVRYQKVTKPWLNRFVDGDEKRSYMVDYYSKNKAKFAEYRRKFRELYPDYYKDYNRNLKNKKNAPSPIKDPAVD